MSKQNALCIKKAEGIFAYGLLDVGVILKKFHFQADICPSGSIFAKTRFLLLSYSYEMV